MRKSRERAEQTREALLNAAERVFLKHGVAGASLEEVARVAGVTRGAVYWHFDNKLQIFLAIGERCILPQDQALRNLEQSEPEDPLAALEDCIVSVFAAYGTDDHVRDRLTVQMLRCDYLGDMAPALQGHAALIHKLSAQFERYFCERLVPAIHAAEWQPRVAAKAFASMLHGSLMLWLRSPDEYSLADTGVGNVRMFMGMLRTHWWPPHQN